MNIQQLIKFAVVSVSVGLALSLSAFGQSSQRDESLKPYLSCQLDSGLKIVQRDRLPKDTKFRTVQTSKGDLKISLADGYRVMVAYNNKRDWFANIKAEKSVPGEYERDKEVVIENLKHAASTTSELENLEPV